MSFFPVFYGKSEHAASSIVHSGYSWGIMIASGACLPLSQTNPLCACQLLRSCLNRALEKLVPLPKKKQKTSRPETLWTCPIPLIWGNLVFLIVYRFPTRCFVVFIFGHSPSRSLPLSQRSQWKCPFSQMSIPQCKACCVTLELKQLYICLAQI